jgi:hypothetical protein
LQDCLLLASLDQRQNNIYHREMTESASDDHSKQPPDLVLTKRYLKADYWAHGTKSNTGAPFASVIQIGVGHSLTNWEHVENSVSLLFAQFTESATMAAARAYGTIIGARARHAAVSEAMDVFFDIRKQKNKQDRKLYNKIIADKENCNSIISKLLQRIKKTKRYCSWYLLGASNKRSC